MLSGKYGLYISLHVVAAACRRSIAVKELRRDAAATLSRAIDTHRRWPEFVS